MGQTTALPVIEKLRHIEQGIIRDFDTTQAETFIQELQRFTQIVARYTQKP